MESRHPRPRALSSSYLEPEERDAGSRNPSKGSALNSPVSKQVCRCGTTVLFPLHVSNRTCWNCGALLQLKCTGLPPSPSSSTASVPRPAGLPKAAQVEPFAGKVSIPVPSSPWSGAALCFVAGLLVASLLVNAALYRESHGGLREDLELLGLRAPDTDGDGVPDPDDFCPGKRPQPGTRSVWISGRASDFDGDGCEDGVEDQDRDNDGIEDKLDRCPFSPKQYNFVSDSINDFDGDGCKDGVEDQDDDGDGVPNEEDECRRTRPGESSDVSGCSKAQHRSNELSRLQEPRAAPHWMSEWLTTLRSAWIEVLLGAIITPIITNAKELLEWLRERMAAAATPGKAKASKGRAVVSLIIRALLYVLFFCGVYAWRSFRDRPVG